MNKMIKNKKCIKAVDFFCGAGGMSYGMSLAGINVIAGIDIDLECKKTYEYNNPSSQFILADIKELTFKQLENNIQLKRNDDDLIFIGCSPCQHWTKMNTTKLKSEATKNLLIDFKRFVEYYHPGHIVIENVPGILSNKKGSGLNDFLSFLDNHKYKTDFKLINAFEYGVPQTRKRFLLIASRVIKNISLPIADKTTMPKVKDFIGSHNGFSKISAGHN